MQLELGARELYALIMPRSNPQDSITTEKSLVGGATLIPSDEILNNIAATSLKISGCQT